MQLTHKMCINNHCRDKITLGVDGGVNINTINDVYNTNIDITIVGSGLYGAKNISERYKHLIGK